MTEPTFDTDTKPPKMASNTPIDFHHPYTPYDVQLDFMRTVYDVLEKGAGQVGILESPTGTVRSPHLKTSLTSSPPTQKKKTI